MTDETIMLKKKRQQLMPRNGTEYKMLSKKHKKEMQESKRCMVQYEEYSNRNLQNINMTGIKS